MKLSIIVPVYNAEKYLDRTIKNILEQTFTDFELLLIDDGSKDCTKVTILLLWIPLIIV